MTKPPANLPELPLEERRDGAQSGAEKVIVEHARQGLPIYVLRDGEVVPTEELRTESARLMSETT